MLQWIGEKISGFIKAINADAGTPPKRGKTERAMRIDAYVREKGWTRPLSDEQFHELDELFPSNP